eukprot:1183791-Prorocentrum_minimum.AAC.2
MLYSFLFHSFTYPGEPLRGSATGEHGALSATSVPQLQGPCPGDPGGRVPPYQPALGSDELRPTDEVPSTDSGRRPIPLMRRAESRRGRRSGETAAGRVADLSRGGGNSSGAPPGRWRLVGRWRNE